ncbi:MAG: RNA polymerase subunit sigma [Bordetella sp. SCN 67-23]|nr:sigma-70 family RNA polymerase sigma factor [Burkholderiales bacterium]ODS68726.1 MAG: RNA polymerase subunit sigma [Bordetella sp. SCN 67-23]ODU69330.1 MAG: RNA polymerase subunit sigma [Bordetella sp. SCN 68-11]OJW93892.1 MAG: RNA polymerase subunit sigma [Burkholderiales bacterium 67-32]
MPATSPREDALSSLYASHHGWLQGWLRRRLGCRFDAADIAHDTFVRVLKACNAADIREPRDYLATIAKGLVVDFYRRAALERAYLDVLASLPQAHQPSVEERALVMEALAQVDAMLSGLPARVRQAFIMSQLEGLTYAEIAAQLDVTVRTVNNYMVKALERCYLAVAAQERLTP